MTKILLVHGGWHGSWCWTKFADRLHDSGHQVRAVQLRGHDRPPGRIWYRVHDYVEDVERAVASFGTPPILVGHSLGGLIVQKYLERHRAPGAVLIASIPPGGTIAAVARLLRRHPILFLRATLLLRLKPFVATRRLVRELFFTPDTPSTIVNMCFECLQDESYLAFIDTMLILPCPRRVRTAILVLGAERDAFFTVAEVRGTARAYGIEAEIFPNIGHDMMLDSGWRLVADRIGEWIRERERAQLGQST